jgi:UDP-GlcNAc:undecaprenyl-phosphate GlcNAc-1-phosphate transferase
MVSGEVSLNAQQVVIPLLAAIAVSALATPLVSRVAILLDVVDRPDERKVNVRPSMPLLGGLAVAAGCLAGLAATWMLVDSEVFEPSKVLGFLLGSALLIAIGVWDDRFALSAREKFPIQILAAAIAIYFEFRIDYFSNPFTGTTYMLPEWLVWSISLLWIVGVTNAMNLIDGLDGLATGLGAIIAGTLVVICWEADQTAGVVIGVAMLGALLGYLPFNFPPARIFLGDTGALFIGYGLALLSMQGYRKAALLTFVVPLLALAVPLLDTVLSIFRRLRSGKGIFQADRFHMHHRLLQKEGSQRRAVLWLYFQTLCFSLIAISFAQLKGLSAYVFLAAVMILTIRLLRNLGLFSMEEEPESSHPSEGAQGGKT